MGVKNKARRAARRRRQQARASGPTRPPIDGLAAPIADPVDDVERAGRLLSDALIAVQFRPTSASEQAQRLRDEIPVRLLAAMLHRCLTDMTAAVVRHGWTPNDVREITGRRLSARHVPLVAALLTGETKRHPAATVSPAWQAELEGLGEPGSTELVDVAEIAQALQLICLFQELPALAQTIAPPGSPPEQFRAGDRSEHKMLARVRALLAKAESTEFPEESEALSAKAQELISAYALDDLAAQPDPSTPGEGLIVRRIWIDAPYVSAKSMLVHAVAEANHCSCVFGGQLGFTALVGRRLDVGACELLVTSLLLQADRAMLHHQGTREGAARSRTTSFRRSFLLAYAIRIGERLRDAADDSLATAARGSDLVPVLAAVDERVRETTERLFPHLVHRDVRISNAMGWAAGRAAADQAEFNVRSQISEEAAS